MPHKFSIDKRFLFRVKASGAKQCRLVMLIKKYWGLPSAPPWPAAFNLLYFAAQPALIHLAESAAQIDFAWAEEHGHKGIWFLRRIKAHAAIKH